MNQNFDDVEAVVNALTSVNYAANSVTTAAIATAAVTSLKGGLGIDTSASAQGGTPYLNGTGTWAILTAGTAGQYYRTGGVSANPAFADDWNPQELTLATAQTEGAGTTTDMDFGATDNITVTITGAQSVFLILICLWNNNDATGGINLFITDNSNNVISGANLNPSSKVASEFEETTVIALDPRPSSGTKVYKCRFNRTGAGTVSLDRRIFIVYTFPDPA